MSDPLATKLQPKVFQMNDCDLMAAYDLDTAKRGYAEFLGYDDFAEAEADGVWDDDARELSDVELEGRQFVYDEDEEPKRSCTFRERLAEIIAERDAALDANYFPCFFAGTEY